MATDPVVGLLDRRGDRLAVRVSIEERRDRIGHRAGTPSGGEGYATLPISSAHARGRLIGDPCGARRSRSDRPCRPKQGGAPPKVQASFERRAPQACTTRSTLEII